MTIGVMLTLNGYDDNRPLIAFALLQNIMTMYLIFIATIQFVAVKTNLIMSFLYHNFFKYSFPCEMAPIISTDDDL